MSLRLPATAATAVVLASLSLSSVLQGVGWLGAGIGAALVVGAAGVASRLPGPRLTIIATAAVAVAVVPLLPGSGWPAVVAGLVIVALTAASATGARPLRGFAIIALYLAALAIFLNLWFAGGSSFGHLIPSHDSVAQLGRMVRDAFAEFRFAPPVPDIRPVSLVGSGGIGLVAIMVDLLAVRMRRPAAAGLPLLVLFSVPVASNLKNFGAQQALAFAAGMAGFLMLLSTASRERLRMWGQLVTFRYVQRADETATGPDTRELAASGRRIGLAAVCLAVIIPLMLPSLTAHHALGAGPGSGAHAGAGSGSGLAVMQQVQQDLREKKPQPVLTYTTTAAAPKYQYFQEYVLNYSARLNEWVPDLTGVFQHPAADHVLPYQPPGQVVGATVTTVQTTATLAKSQASVNNFLPVPYAPVKLTSGSSGWSELPGSLMLYNPSEPPGRLRYTVTSSEPQLTAADLVAATGNAPASISSQYGSYTGPDAARLAVIAHQRTDRATTELQEALELQDWFQAGSFTYTLTPRLPASHWLLAFLTTKRRGYCQQFAWAFAVLARLLGIPARVAVGYTAGKPGPGGNWLVTTADTHAWPELYFPGEGWVRFEPTPNGATTGQGTATVPAYATGSPGHGLPPANPGGSAATGAAGGALGSAARGLNGGQRPQPGQGIAISPIAGTSAWLTIGLPLLVLLLLMSSPAAARRLTRRRRWLVAHGDAATAAAAWRELTDDLTDYGRSRAPGETPRALARRLTREADLDPVTAQALGRVVKAAERAAYATRPEPGVGLSADVSQVRRAVAAATPLRRRIRARLLPASTLALAQDRLQRLGDMLSWLDTSLPAMERRAYQRRAERARPEPPSAPSQTQAAKAEPRELAGARRD
jgi:transglutaminase-like putative cysteine protease